MRFHAQLCQDIKEGLSSGMWPPHTQGPDSHCNPLVSMAHPCRLSPCPCRQSFGHHAVTLLVTFLYCVTVTMLLIYVHVVLPHIILHWHRKGLIHKYQPSANLHLKNWSLSIRLWAFMSHLKWGHNLLNEVFNRVLNGIKNLSFWTPFHILCESTSGYNIAQAKFLDPLPTLALKPLACEKVLWLNINCNWFLYKTNSCPGDLLHLFISLTLPFFIYRSPHVLNKNFH